MGCCSSIKQYTDAVIQPKSQDSAYTCILVNQQNQSIYQMHSVDFQHFQDDRYIYFELDETHWTNLKTCPHLIRILAKKGGEELDRSVFHASCEDHPVVSHEFLVKGHRVQEHHQRTGKGTLRLRASHMGAQHPLLIYHFLSRR